MNNIQGKASIVIITYNNLDFTRQCLASIFSKPAGTDYEVIVVDNASQDETPSYLKEFEKEHSNVRVVLNGCNEGFARGNNIGAKSATSDFIVFLNNDTVVTPGWLASLLQHLNRPGVGMVGPVTNASSNETRVLVPYENVDGLDEFASQYTSSHAGESFEIRTLAFLCVAIRREVFEEIGPLDERFGLGMFEDDDYAMRLREKGYHLECAEDVYIHHWGGQSFLKLPSYDYWVLFRQNRKKFEEKWGIKWQPHQHRKELLPFQVTQLTEWGYELQWKLVQVDRQIQALTEQIFERDNEVLTLSHQLDERNRFVADLNQSKAWKAIRMVWRIRLAILPRHSRREKALALLFRGRWKELASLYQTEGQPSHGQPVDGLSVKEKPIPGDESRRMTRRVELTDRHVAILTSQFFDYEGQDLYLGGAERYLVELAGLVQQSGFQPVVYQSANESWVREYAGIPVHGLETGGNDQRLNLLFHGDLPANGLVIYLAFYLAAPRCHSHSIGISHGVYWDENPGRSLEDQQQRYREILAPISRIARMVSVDTNTINWVRSLQSSLADKFVYIPNFVDLSRFKPGTHPNNNRLVVLYPRRLYPPRGFWLVKEIVQEFIEAYPHVEFHFVGQANLPEETAVRELVRIHPHRVRWYSLPLEDMHKAYEQADITLIPTIHSEGTSLSCLEAMASGNAVIATNVGGLPDLVLSGYNGLLIEPNARALKEALQQLVMDQDLRHTIAQRGVEVAATFSLERWRAGWTRVLREFLS